MNPIQNPFSPGAGSQPPELAGRSELLEKVNISIERVRIGRASKSVLMVGLRGVGKTVLLDRMRGQAEALGNATIRLEAPENKSLPAMLAPELRHLLLKLSAVRASQAAAKRALQALAGFAKALKFKYQDIEVGLDLDPEKGLADNGDLESDLLALLTSIGDAAKAADRAVVLFIDELQYVAEEELAALITCLHRTSQLSLPLIMVGAGLPQLRGKMGKAKSYAERLFDFPSIGPLDRPAARQALSKPTQSLQVEWEPSALEDVVSATRGYPYFLQEWGKHVWDLAEDSPIEQDDVQRATPIVIAALDESFFRVRFDRLTPSEKRYMRAMAELGEGPHRSGDIAELLQRKVTALGPTRNSLISKGMIWSPGHGDTAFTVPMFDEFMKRTMPNLETN
ncbi:MAG: ATP-binding protein [Pirellula sp.]